MNIRTALWCFGLLFSSLSGWGQLQFAIESQEVYFPPTTIDSTATMSLLIINELSLAQDVQLSGLEAPFFAATSFVTISANDTLSVGVSFVPNGIATHADTLIISGNVFGVDTLILYGEGTLPVVSFVQSEVNFGVVSINSTHHRHFHITNTGVGTLVIGDIETSIDEFSCSGFQEILPGDTATFDVEFYTELANVYNGVLQIATSDPFAPLVEIALTADAISQVGGNLCGNLSLINSPYVFIENVLVPPECDLSIEPGVVVDLNGYILNVQGTLDANGTEDSRITIQNGQVQLTQSNYSTSFVDYSNNASLNLVGRETVYFNDFEDGNQPFYCSGTNASGGTSGQGSYQCDDFYNIEDLTWSSNGLRSLRFNSYYYTGELYLNEPIINLESGLYQWSFLHRQRTAEDNVRLIASYRINNGGWVEFYRTPEDSFCDSSEHSGAFSEFIEVPESGTLNIRFQHSVGGSPCNDRGMTYLDDIRLERVSQLPIESYIYSNQATLGGSSTSASSGVAVAGASFAFGSIGNSLKLQTGIGQPTAYWISRPISVHSNRLFIDYFEQVTTADQNCWYYTDYRVNDGDWILLREDQAIQCGDGSIGTHGWEQRKYILENLEFGDQVEFRLRVEAYDIGNPIYRDVTIYFDEFRVREDFSQPVAIKSESPEAFLFSETSIQGDCLFLGDSLTLSVMSSNVEGIFVEGGSAQFTVEDSELKKADLAYSNCQMTLTNSVVSDETGNGIYLGSESILTLYNSSVVNCGGSAITVGPNSQVGLSYSFLTNNGGDGIELGLGSQADVANSLIGFNLGYGINSAGAADVDYSVIQGNGKQGLLTSQFSTIDNSIVWFNAGVPQMLTDNVYSVSYSNVQGINALLTSSDFAWGDGCIGTDPVFADDEGHLDPYSPCVDGGMPWEQDAHIPLGLGSSRADMGLYGGPSNAFWGGQAPPDGAVIITEVFDIPNDQGNALGIQFLASPFDFGGLGFNVTHYSIWRDLAVASDTIIDVADGNWEQVGTVPAQGFNQYGYTAESLVNSFPGSAGCMTNFIVLAHTTDDNIYWVSDVAGACAVDNLAPAEPELDGMILADGGAQISWPEPMEEDYAFTEVFNDAGFNATVGTDTLVVDAAAVAGQTYTYTAIHYDVNGNASEPASLTLEVAAGSDAIALTAGWNLISVDRALSGAPLGEVFGGLASENLQYVTGFQNGVQFYNPNGLSFLNTLSSLDDGYGYWVKVAEDDLLEVSGASLPDGFRPPLTAGWNLIGYPNAGPSDPAAYFADLIADENLVYVTGFDEGAQVFDPNGLAFLNTLPALQNGFGYWVKTVNGDDPNGLAPTNEKANPNYMVLNGRSDLAHAAGSTVSVLAPSGETVAILPILDGGYLMTTAIFGADPSSAAAWGLAPGDELRFAFNGKLADQTLSYEGAMAHKALDLTFTDSAASLTVWPNPARSEVQVQFNLAKNEDVVFLIIRDVLGRQVGSRMLQDLSPGPHTHLFDLTGLTAGYYDLSVEGNGLYLAYKLVLAQ